MTREEKVKKYSAQIAHNHFLSENKTERDKQFWERYCESRGLALDQVEMHAFNPARYEKQINTLLDAIEAKDSAYLLNAIHPQNKETVKIFIAETGVKFAKINVGALQDGVQTWLAS